MKNSLRYGFRPLLHIAIRVSLTALPGAAVAATNRYWNAGGAGGDGIWGTSPGDKNWNLVPGAPAGNTVWPDSVDDVAVFQDVIGGTVTVFTPVQAAGIVLNGANHVINAGTITLVRDSSFNDPFISVRSGELSIDSVIAGTQGVTKTGGGNVTLSGANTYTGTTTVTAGTLTLTGSLVPGDVVTEGGTLAVNRAASVLTYSQKNGGILAGAAALTTTGGATLAGGTIAGSLLGDITVSGAVLASGTLGGGSLDVAGAGTLTLTGSYTGSSVTIFQNGGLVNANGGLADSAAVTNAGTLTVIAGDFISTYLQNPGGTLAGPGILHAAGGATLAGGTISGNLAADITISGSAAISGNVTGASLSVRGGILALSGRSDHALVAISGNSTLSDFSGGLAAGAEVTNAGWLEVHADETVRTYVQNGGISRLGGDRTLAVTDGIELNGGSVSGKLSGNATTTGTVLVSGEIGGGNLAVTGGTLTLSGTATNENIRISPSASLVDSDAGLSGLASVTNSGRLAVATPDEVLTYVSNGGLLEGAGRLSAATAALNDKSSVTGSLEAGQITTRGAVFIGGSAVSENIRIRSGTLTNTGLLGGNSSHLDIASGATLVASGTQLYRRLTSSGSGAATWQGNLQNFATVAPGGGNAFGKLGVTGDFTNAPGGTLKMDVAVADRDQLGVGGTAAFGGVLAVTQTGPGQIAPYIPLQLISAGSYTGNFSSFRENLDGAVFFNPQNGSITRFGSGSASGSLFSGTTRNQRSTWISLYDDVIDPGKRNATRDRSGVQIGSGIADVGNPDLLHALAASFTPAGLDGNLLNRLSAEVHTSMTDYAVQATRQHQRTAFSAPALAPLAESSGYSSKSSAKDAIPAAPSFARNWEFFAAADYFHAETDTSQNQADYELSGAAFVFGARSQLSRLFQVAAYAAADTGSIDGSLIDSDQDGWSLGLIGESLLDAKSQTILTTAVSYGSYEADGARQSASATAAGWAPGKVNFENVASDSLQLYAGVETTVYRDQRFRVILSAGLRHTSATMDKFTESTGSAVGSPIALRVGRGRYHQWSLEMGVTAEARLSDQFTLRGQVGGNAGLGDDSHDIRSSFAKGSRSMSAKADGLTDDLFYLGLGLEYRIDSDVSVALGCRSDCRPGHPVEQGVNISTAFRF